MRNCATVLFCLLLVSCAPADEPPKAPQAAAPINDDLQERVDAICADELKWRFPNSMAQTLSDDGRGMRLDLIRARVLLGTQDLARHLNEGQVARLLKSLQETPPDEEYRALVHARLLAATGVPEPEISAIRPDLRDEYVWDEVIREGIALREVG